MSERPARSGVWRLLVFLGRDPLTGQPVQRQETFRGSETAVRKVSPAELVTAAGDGKFDRSEQAVRKPGLYAFSPSRSCRPAVD